MKTNTFLTKKKSLFVVFSLLASFCYASSVSSASISSFSVSSDTVNIDLTPTATTTSSATGSHTATITTDCSSGYKIYVSMTSDAVDNKLHLNGDNSNATVGTNALGPTAGSFDTMATLSGNSWGVKVGTGSASSNFAAVPTYSVISTTNQSANPTALITGSSSASNTSYTITYGANANSALTPGEYSGNVLYTAITNSSCSTADVSVVKGTGIASVSLDGLNPAAITNGQKATYNIGSTATASYTLEPGYHYSNWTASPDVTITKSNTAGSGSTVGSGTGSFTVPSTGITVSPQGTANTYTIKYNAGTDVSGSAETTSQTGTYGTNVTTSAAGTLRKDGYFLKGWSHTDGSDTATYDANTSTAVSTIASNAGVTNTDVAEINLYAVWYPILIAYAYDDADDGDFIDIYLAHEDEYNDNEYCGDGESARCEFAPGEKVYISVGWIRDGYGFTSWNVETESGETVSVDSSTSSTTYFIMPTESVTIYAVGYPSLIAYAYNDADDGDFVDIYLAHEDEYNNGDYCDSSEEAQCEFESGEKVYISVGRISSGYNFISWNVETESGETVSVDSSTSSTTYFIMPTESVTIYAVGSSNPIAYAYNDADDGDFVDIYLAHEDEYNNDEYCSDGESARCAFDPGEKVYISVGWTRGGYGFTGWNVETESGETVSVDSSTSSTTYFIMPTESVTIYANTTIVYYILTTVNGDTTHISSITSGGGSKQYDSSQTVTCTPIAGYSCSWYNGTRQVSTGNTYTFKMPASDLTLTAKATANSYTLTVSNGNTTAISSVSSGGTYTYGSSVTVTCNPKSGYICTGWTSSDTSLIANSSSVSYTFTMPAGDVTLTANAKEGAYMQGWTGCDSLDIGSSVTLTDSRDYNEYTVKKLADGKCWMAQNLRLSNKTITSADSNITASSFTVPASTTGWGTSSDGNSATSTKTYDTGDTSYGVLYNYATATAGTSWYGGGVDSGNLTQDICPKGWRFPTGGSSGEFVALDKAHGGAGTDRSNANTYSNFTGSDMSFVFPGRYASGSHDRAGTLGFYWSSSQSNSNDAYGLYLYSSYSLVAPQNYSSKYYGYSVRCIAKSDSEKTISDLYYMQGINQTIINNTPQGTSAILTDSRDNKTYTVKKLKDDKIWMTQNLALIDTIISSDDSNLPSGTTFAVPAHSTGWGVNGSDGDSATSTRVFDTTRDPDSTNATDATNGKWGVLYNYVTATGGGSWYRDGIRLPNTNITQDICPKGWRLPTSGSLDAATGLGDFQTLLDNYNSIALLQDASGPQLVFSGYYGYARHANVNWGGHYWSSTRTGMDEDAYDFFLNSSRVNSHSNSYRYEGQAIRCLAE